MKVVRNEFHLVLKTALFVLCVGLAGVLFGAYPAVAHESPAGTTPSAEHPDDMPRAQDVDRMDEASMKNFMRHMKIHFEGTEDQEDATIYILEDWRSLEEDFYRITVSHGNRIATHEKYPQAQSASLPALGSIVAKARESEDAVCEQDEEGNYFCAVLIGRGITVSGFVHDSDDLDFSQLSCPYVTPGSGADKDKVAADEVTNEDTPENRERLKRYVIGMEKHLLEKLGEVYGPARARGLDHASALAEAQGALGLLRPCWRIWPWKYGSIYVFIILEAHGGGQFVIFNGNNPEFEGPDLFVMDEDGVDVGKLIADEVRDPDGDGFIEYKWDDPQNPDDDVEVGPRGEGFRDAPGTSLKVSYVKEVDNFPGFIIGSGFYPQVESGDGGGCAVSGESSTPSGAAFNLFLAVSVLLSGIWLFSGGKVQERLRR